MKKIFVCAISIGFVAFLSSQPSKFRDIQNNIGLCATVCADDESIVDSGGWKLPAVAFIEKGYTPVRVQIKNMSDQAVSLSEASIQYAKPDVRKLIEFFEHPEILNTLKRWVILTVPCMCIAYLASLYSMLTTRYSHDITQSDPGTKIFLVCRVLQVINTIIIAPYDYITLQNLNKRLGGALRKALPTGSMIVKPGSSAEKIFLIPQDTCKPFEFQVFHEHTDTAATTFLINIF